MKKPAHPQPITPPELLIQDPDSSTQEFRQPKTPPMPPPPDLLRRMKAETEEDSNAENKDKVADDGAVPSMCCTPWTFDKILYYQDAWGNWKYNRDPPTEPPFPGMLFQGYHFSKDASGADTVSLWWSQGGVRRPRPAGGKGQKQQGKIPRVVAPPASSASSSAAGYEEHWAPQWNQGAHIHMYVCTYVLRVCVHTYVDASYAKV